MPRRGGGGGTYIRAAYRQRMPKAYIGSLYLTIALPCFQFAVCDRIARRFLASCDPSVTLPRDGVSLSRLPSVRHLPDSRKSDAHYDL